jgi:hypothetical protein
MPPLDELVWQATGGGLDMGAPPSGAAGPTAGGTTGVTAELAPSFSIENALDLARSLGIAPETGAGWGNLAGTVGTALTGIPGLALGGAAIGTAIDQTEANRDLSNVGAAPLDFGSFLSSLLNNVSFGLLGESTADAAKGSAAGGTMAVSTGGLMGPGQTAGPLQGSPAAPGGGLPAAGGGMGGDTGFDFGSIGMDLGLDLGGMAGAGSSPGGV